MAWRRSALEPLVALAHGVRPAQVRPPESPTSIFVLRPNDLGDVLVTTPLLAALRSQFPSARIVAGVGPWSHDLLANNPNVDAIADVPAPWHNKYVDDQSILAQMRFVLGAPEVAALRREQFDIGIDVLGSGMGSLLLQRIGARYRMGVRGYAGGHTGVHASVRYDPNEYVGRAALRFAELLGATSLPEARPQIFLSPSERAGGDALWPSRVTGRRRWVLAPGAGLPAKAWLAADYAAIADQLASVTDVDWMIVGSSTDRDLGESLATRLDRATNHAGALSLRMSMAAIDAADGFVGSPSVMMHVAAAFETPSVILLGDAFDSATAHAAQWGYPGRWINLGREPGQPRPSVEDAVEAIRRTLGSSP